MKGNSLINSEINSITRNLLLIHSLKSRFLFQGGRMWIPLYFKRLLTPNNDLPLMIPKAITIL